jgi:hypothetical protein
MDLDGQMDQLELEWRRAYEASIAARGDYQSLAARGAGADLLDVAREGLERAEAFKARVMARIERLEDSLLGSNSLRR